MQELEGEPAQLGQLHRHVVGQAVHQRAAVGPGGVHERRLVGALGLVAQLRCLPAGGAPRGPAARLADTVAGERHGLARLLLGPERSADAGRAGQAAGARLVRAPVGGQAAEAVAARSPAAGREPPEEVFYGLHGGLQLKPHPHLQEKQGSEVCSGGLRHGSPMSQISGVCMENGNQTIVPLRLFYFT